MIRSKVRITEGDRVWSKVQTHGVRMRCEGKSVQQAAYYILKYMNLKLHIFKELRCCVDVNDNTAMT